MNSSGVEGGGAGVANAPPKVDLPKILANALKIWIKMTPNVVWLQKMVPKVYMKTHEDLFLEVTPKKRSSWSCGRKFVGKSCTKTFRAILGKFGKNPSHPKNLPAPTPMMKRHHRPRCPSFERAVGEMPSPCLHSPASLCILFYTHSLLFVVGYNVSLLWT